MGANNWAICPRCKQRRLNSIAQKEREFKDAYGKVAPEKFFEMKSELDNLKDSEYEVNMREDYEIYTDEDGEFFITYSCSCKTCGWGHKYQNKYQAYDATKDL